jgi:hypothetical protein
MVKIKQKVSGCLRTLAGAQDFAAMRSYLATAARHGRRPFDVLTELTRRHDAAHRGGGPGFVIVDGHPAHRAQAVTDFVTSTDGALRLYRLLAYSPQLNPDE